MKSITMVICELIGIIRTKQSLLGQHVLTLNSIWFYIEPLWFTIRQAGFTL